VGDYYTPSTDVVRAEYWEHGAYRYGAARGDEFQAEFDRWLAAHEESVRADHEKAVRERIAQDIVRELGDGRAADIVRKGA